MKNVAVCGAGIGGMVSAIYLADKGHEVNIYEKNEQPGGKMSEYIKDGFRFDTGPSLITMPQVFYDFFRDISLDINDYLELIKLEKDCKYFWSDKTIFDSYCSKEKLSEELKLVFGEDEEKNFFRYLEYGKLFYELSKDNFLKSEFKIRNYVSTEGLKNFTKFISGKSVNDLSNKFFKDRRLKQLMDRFATYNGSTPYLSPQFFSIIPYVEYEFGAWYVKGGIYKIAKALERICLERNIEIHYKHELNDTEVSGKNISKIYFKTRDNNVRQIENFDSVVLNFTNNAELMDKDYFEIDDWSCSGYIILLGMNKEFNELSHHNILFSDDYEKEFIDIFEKKVPADDMTIYISISKKDDNTDAPTGCENWFILVNAPYINKNTQWTEGNKQLYKNKILDKIDSFKFLFDESIRDHIKFCEIFTPDDFLKKYNSEFGSIYGLSSNSLYTLIKRPKNKSKKFDNLFFAGGNTHPGGGVPLCFLSGKIV
ncbi:MAG: phytoene desaturase family protein, partial [Ignavibacteria bacterium]